MAEKQKQLTVAELLARAKEEESAPATPRRRRHRSLEEGGVSVAELTGNIPRVNATPEGARHGAPAPAPVPPVHIIADGEKAPLVTGSFHAITPEQAKPAPTPVEPEKTQVMDTVPEAAIPEPEEKKATVTVLNEPEVPVHEPVAEEEVPAPEPDDVEYEDDQMSLTGIIVTAVIGIVLGILIFKAFEWLWASALMPLLVILLAVVVTAVVGAGVHALRPNKDGLTTGLAIFTALVLTFGPVAIAGL